MNPDKMTRRELSETVVENGKKIYCVIFLVLFLSVLAAIIILSITQKNFFDHRLTFAVTALLLPIIFLLKCKFPRLNWKHMLGFIVFLLLIEFVGHSIAEHYDFPPAFLFSHVILEVISGPIAFLVFAKFYLKLPIRS